MKTSSNPFVQQMKHREKLSYFNFIAKTDKQKIP